MPPRKPIAIANSVLLAPKLFFACLSGTGFLLGVLILYFLRPSMFARTLLVSGAALTLVSAILLSGDLFAGETVSDSYPLLKEAGWFALGLLFGSGRGDTIVYYIDKHKQAKSGVSIEKSESKIELSISDSDSPADSDSGASSNS